MEVFQAFISFDNDRNAEFVDLSIIRFLCPSHASTWDTHLARKITTWVKAIINNNRCTESMHDVYLPKGVTSGGTGLRSRTALLRMDYFDNLIITGPANLFSLTWTSERIRYVQLYYPSFPIPGTTQQLPRKMFPRTFS